MIALNDYTQSVFTYIIILSNQCLHIIIIPIQCLNIIITPNQFLNIKIFYTQSVCKHNNCIFSISVYFYAKHLIGVCILMPNQSKYNHTHSFCKIISFQCKHIIITNRHVYMYIIFFIQ